MPSPVGHALAGVAAGWWAGSRSRPRWLWYAVAGMLADLDLLVGSHSGPTHGLGAAVIAGVVVYAITGRAGRWRLRFGAALAASYASHTLLDWLGSDTSPPIGIQALWPFSRAYFESGLHIFPAISRRYWLPEFWSSNARAVAYELLVLLPVLGVTAWMRRPVATWMRRPGVRPGARGDC